MIKVCRTNEAGRRGTGAVGSIWLAIAAKAKKAEEE